MVRCSLQDIFTQHFDSFAAQRKLHPRESRAAWCIRHCFTPECGAHRLVCPAGHFEQLQFHACRHRSCPRCANAPRQVWLQAQLQRLLPCPHFHVVFTLAHVLLPLWAFNRSAMASLLLGCVRDTLLQLMADPQRCGVRPGLMMALHTWGRNLSQHPHVHCLLSAGGITPEGSWKSTGTRFLLPLKLLQHLFRGKLLAQLKALLQDQRLALPPDQDLPYWLGVIGSLYRAHWNVQIQRPYAHARGVALYLSRYVKGGPIPADRPLSLDARGLVRMPYTDHRDGRTKTLCLHAHEFIDRVLWHAPARGLHTVRYAGLYTSSASAQYLAARQHLGAFEANTRNSDRPLAANTNPPLALPRCPHCNATLIRHRLPVGMHCRSAISLHTTAADPAAVHPGPTGRSTGPPTAGRHTPPAFHLPVPASCLRPVS